MELSCLPLGRLLSFQPKPPPNPRSTVQSSSSCSGGNFLHLIGCDGAMGLNCLPLGRLLSFQPKPPSNPRSTVQSSSSSCSGCNFLHLIGCDGTHLFTTQADYYLFSRSRLQIRDPPSSQSIDLFRTIKLVSNQKQCVQHVQFTFEQSAYKVVKFK